MHLLNFTVVVLAITAEICWGGIIVEHSELTKSTQLPDAVVNIVECYYNNGGKGAVLVGHMPESFYRKLSEKLVSVTLLGSYRTKAYKDRFYRWELYKLNVFVLASSPKKFDEIVRLTENSKWWDRTGHHLIVDWSSPKNDGCIDSVKSLLKAWEYSMINARVICQNRTEEVMLYGYNPYTTEARKSWKLERIYSKNMLHPFTLFSQVYRNRHEICETVGAEMTTNLAGHPFCCIQPFQQRQSALSKFKSSMLASLEIQNVFRIMLSSLNATMVYENYYTNGSQFRPDYDIEKCMEPSWTEISSAVGNVADIGFGYRMFSYPIKKVEFLAVTKFRGHLTQVQKILGVTDVSSRMGLYLVLLLTLLFFKFFVRHSGMASFLNVFRIVCNTGFTNMPDGLSSRLYIGAVLLFAVVMQGIYQGNLAALLTQTIPIRDAMTKQDLVDMNYTIFGSNRYLDMCFTDSIFDGHVEAIRNFCPCSKRLLEPQMTACLYVAPRAKDVASQFKLHVVSQTMGSTYASYPFPLITDLEERINMILLKIREADIMVPINLRGLDRRISEFEFDEEVQKNQDYKVITLGELEFAFVILGIGLSCATITFIIELAIARRSRTISTRIQFLN